MAQFVLLSSAGFYTGRAGQAWVAADKAEAFAFTSRVEAERKATLFNGRTILHGLTFTVEAV